MVRKWLSPRRFTAIGHRSPRGRATATGSQAAAAIATAGAVSSLVVVAASAVLLTSVPADSWALVPFPFLRSRGHGSFLSRSRLEGRAARLTCVRSVPLAVAHPQGASNEELPGTLLDAAEDTLQQLRSKRPQVHDKIFRHELPPLLTKTWWTHVGDLATAQESGEAGFLPSDQWISLRLDGHAWGTLLTRIRKCGILGEGFSDKIAESMMACCQAVMKEFGGVLGYTHSDEMTVLIPPASTRESSTSGLCRSSDLSSWVSIAASVASAEFTRRMIVLAAERGAELDGVIVAHFDCRAGVYATAREAEALVLWRAYDCGVNSASDAIKFSGAPKYVRRLNTIQKLLYLEDHDMLPLERHQGYGSLFVVRGGDGSQTGPELINSGDDGGHKHLLNIVRSASLLSPAVPELG